MLSPLSHPPPPIRVLPHPPIYSLLPSGPGIKGHRAFTGPRASPPTDAWQGHPLLHMRMEPGSLHVCSLVGGLVPRSSGMSGWYCCSSYGVANPFSSFSPFNNSSIGDPVLSSMVGCKHPPPYLSGSGRASQETALSGSCQHALLGIRNSDWVWWLCIWVDPQVGQSLDGLSFSLYSTLCSTQNAPVSILFPFLRRTEASTIWSSFVLSFMWNFIIILENFSSFLSILNIECRKKTNDNKRQNCHRRI